MKNLPETPRRSRWWYASEGLRKRPSVHIEPHYAKDVGQNWQKFESGGTFVMGRLRLFFFGWWWGSFEPPSSLNPSVQWGPFEPPLPLSPSIHCYRNVGRVPGRSLIGTPWCWESVRLISFYTRRNIFEILSNQPEIRLYIQFSDWFGTKRTLSVCCSKSIRKW